MLRSLLSLTVLIVALAFQAKPVLAQMPSQNDIDRAWYDFLDHDDPRALEVLQRAANAGDAPSQAMVAWAHEIGKVVAEDTEQAIFWYQEAALQNYGDAYSSLGLMYYYGRPDLPQDYDLAQAYYQAGIALNDPESHSFLGYMYQEGHGVVQDYNRAAELYRQSADLGEGYGAAQYAWLLREGLGVVKDEAASRRYYQIAIDSGYEQAYADLGHLLHRGIGGPIDLNGALSMYVQAIENDVAYGGIGGSYLILENPTEFPDPVMGLSLCFWAVENADPTDQLDYKDDCDYWASEFSPGDIARANELAAGY